MDIALRYVPASRNEPTAMSASANKLKPVRASGTFFTEPSGMRLSIMVIGLASTRCARAALGRPSPNSASAAIADHVNLLGWRVSAAARGRKNV